MTPVLVLIEVLPGEQQGWRKTVHEVRFTAGARSEYGWGLERAHARGQRFGAGVWIYTDGPIEYRDDDGWHTAP